MLPELLPARKTGHVRQALRRPRLRSWHRRVPSAEGRRTTGGKDLGFPADCLEQWWPREARSLPLLSGTRVPRAVQQAWALRPACRDILRAIRPGEESTLALRQRGRKVHHGGG